MLPERPRPVADVPNSTGARILIIEDDPDVRLFMMLALAGEGYQVSSAADAHEAVDQLTRGGFDLVLTDYGLPGKDGLALLDEAEQKGLLQGVQAIVLTAVPWLARKARVPVIPKPVDVDSLMERLRAMLETTAASTRARR